MAQPVTQQDTQPPAETLAEAHARLESALDEHFPYAGCRDDLRHIWNALTRRAGGAFLPDAKAEYPAFASWWTRTVPHEPVPNAASHHFDAWMASARRAGGDAMERFVRTIADMVGDELDAHASVELRDRARAILAGGDAIPAGWQLVPTGEPVSLNDCPPGPFEFQGDLGYRSEYATTLENPRRYQVDAYCFDTGEYFWGGASGTEARGKLIVQPLTLTATPNPPAGGDAGDGFIVKLDNWMTISVEDGDMILRNEAGDPIGYAKLGPDAALALPAPVVEPFQARVQPWMMACFGEIIAGDREERNHRFIEEALELVQACGCTASEAHQLVDYVYGRPVGEPAQEVGGVMVTLAALCLANGLDMHANAETELARIWTKVEAIRAKQAAKPKHSPLPEHPAALALPAPVVEGEPFLAQLRRVNTDRYQAWVGDGEDGGLLFDATELGGEVGELLNVVKKLYREQRGWRGSRAGPDDFADECADVLICLDKLARRGGVDLEAATIRKFNATSEKHDFPHRLSEGRSHG